MATYKIMLVEDDNNLRAIYGDRLMAEGYEIVSARDGEEALALAVKEKPSLIISDVMMPKISGFDMLDILRSTPETKDVKVIMMTALSQTEDKARADKLGADKYLVKSQVTLEDVARVVHEVLGDQSAAAETNPETQAAAPVAAAEVPAPAPAPAPEPMMAAPIVPAPEPAVQAAAPVPNPISDPVQIPEPPVIPDPVVSPAPAPAATAAPMIPIPDPAPADDSIMQQPVTPAPDPAAQAVVSNPNPISDPMPVSAPAQPASTPSDDDLTETAAAAETPAPEGSGDPSGGVKKVIQPLNPDLAEPGTPKIYALYEKEMAEQAKMSPVINPVAGSIAPTEPATEPEPEPSSAPQLDLSKLQDPSAVVVDPSTLSAPSTAPAAANLPPAPTEASPTAPGTAFDPNQVAL